MDSPALSLGQLVEVSSLPRPPLLPAPSGPLCSFGLIARFAPHLQLPPMPAASFQDPEFHHGLDQQGWSRRGTQECVHHKDALLSPESPASITSVRLSAAASMGTTRHSSFNMFLVCVHAKSLQLSDSLRPRGL